MIKAADGCFQLAVKPRDCMIPFICIIFHLTGFVCLGTLPILILVLKGSKLLCCHI